MNKIVRNLFKKTFIKGGLLVLKKKKHQKGGINSSGKQNKKKSNREQTKERRSCSQSKMNLRGFEKRGVFVSNLDTLFLSVCPHAPPIFNGILRDRNVKITFPNQR